MLPDTALREVSTADPVTILAPLVAALAAVALVYGPRHLGDDARLWRAVRSLLPHVDDEARERGFYTSYTIDPDEETAGVWTGTLAELEDALREGGFILGPLAAHKALPDGRHEHGSWVRFGRDVRSWPAIARLLYKLIAPYQTHPTVFPGDVEGEWLVTGHHEYSAYSPLFAYWHLQKKYYDPDEGVRRIVDALEDYDAFEPTDRARDLDAEAAIAADL